MWILIGFERKVYFMQTKKKHFFPLLFFSMGFSIKVILNENSNVKSSSHSSQDIPKTTFNENTKDYNSFAIIIYGNIHKIHKPYENPFNASCQLPAVLHTNTQTPNTERIQTETSCFTIFINIQGENMICPMHTFCITKMNN